MFDSMTYDWQSLYLITSALIAIVIWMQMYIIKKNDGKMPPSGLVHFLSFLESAWMFVSGAAFYFLDLQGLAICIPAIYIVYSVLAFFYAARTIEIDASISSIDDICFDVRYINFCQAFAQVYFVFCLAVLFVPSYYFEILNIY